MPAGFADPWGLPSTAVYGTPNGDDNRDSGARHANGQELTRRILDKQPTRQRR